MVCSMWLSFIGIASDAKKTLTGTRHMYIFLASCSQRIPSIFSMFIVWYIIKDQHIIIMNHCQRIMASIQMCTNQQQEVITGINKFNNQYQDALRCINPSVHPQGDPLTRWQCQVSTAFPGYCSSSRGKEVGISPWSSRRGWWDLALQVLEGSDSTGVECCNQSWQLIRADRCTRGFDSDIPVLLPIGSVLSVICSCRLIDH